MLTLAAAIAFVAAGCSSKSKTPYAPAETQGPPPPPAAEAFGPPLPPPENMGPPEPPQGIVMTPPVPVVAPQPQHGITLVLSGAGLRGFAQLGVIQELEDREVDIGRVVASESAALVASLWISYGINKATWELHKFSKGDFYEPAIFSLERHANGKTFAKTLEKWFGKNSIETLKKPLEIAVQKNGNAKSFHQGLLAGALSDSFASTGFVKANVTGDGPEYIARRPETTEKIVCVDTRANENDSNEAPIAKLSEQIETEIMKDCDVRIHVDTNGIHLDDFDKKAELIERGRTAVQAWFDQGNKLE